MGHDQVELFRGLLEVLRHPFEDVCIRESMGAVLSKRDVSFAFGLGDRVGVNLRWEG